MPSSRPIKRERGASVDFMSSSPPPKKPAVDRFAAAMEKHAEEIRRLEVKLKADADQLENKRMQKEEAKEYLDHLQTEAAWLVLREEDVVRARDAEEEAQQAVVAAQAIAAQKRVWLERKEGMLHDSKKSEKLVPMQKAKLAALEAEIQALRSAYNDGTAKELDAARKKLKDLQEARKEQDQILEEEAALQLRKAKAAERLRSLTSA